MILNNKYLLQDIESGEWREVSKEEHDAYQQRIKEISEAVIKLGYKPVCYLAGTNDNHKDFDDSFEKLWRNQSKKN